MEPSSSLTSVIFLAASFFAVGVFLFGAKKAAQTGTAAKVALFLVPFWMMFQAGLGLGGFYRVFEVFPPRIVLFGVLPANLLLLSTLLIARENFVHKLPLTALTVIHIVRIPVEIVLHQLYQEGSVPRAMTFEGHNFDIIFGISAIVVYFLTFRGERHNAKLLIAWNIVGLIFLAIIVTTAVLAFPSPMQKIAFEQPNIAVTMFPFVWLPTVIVPLVFFSHLASLVKLVSKRAC